MTIDHTSLTDSAYQILLEMVVRRDLRPGERLSLVGLSDMLGVSRSPVKEAMDRLEAEGLVEISPRRGTFVRPLRRKDIEDIFELRLLIEPYAGRVGAANITDAQIGRAKVAIETFRKAATGGKLRDGALEKIARADRELHELIVESAGNGRLASVYRNLNVVIHVTRFVIVRGMGPSRAANAGNEHQAIFAALCARDGTRLADALEAHIISTRDEILTRDGGIGEEELL